MEIVEKIKLSLGLNIALFGKANPSPIDKSIRRQYKDKKLKDKIDKIFRGKLWLQ